MTESDIHMSALGPGRAYLEVPTGGKLGGARKDRGLQKSQIRGWKWRVTYSPIWRYLTVHACTEQSRSSYSKVAGQEPAQACTYVRHWHRARNRERGSGEQQARTNVCRAATLNHGPRWGFSFSVGASRGCAAELYTLSALRSP